MERILRELKEDFCAVGLKSEFEAEGSTLQDAQELALLAKKCFFEHSIKIGGAQAIKEMYEAKELKADCLIAPMIETPYALEKFILGIKEVFTEEKKPRFYINIETITTIENLNIMFENTYMLSGVVFGRGDLSASMKICHRAQAISDIAKKVLQEAKNHNLETIVGGKICLDSYEFLSNIKTLDKFETRKIIFDATLLRQDNFDKGIKLALEFELAWLENRKHKRQKDEERAQYLKKMIFQTSV